MRLAAYLGLAFFTCAALLGALGPGVSAEEAKGFTPLFNGKDLTGWSGDSELWRVEEGEIVGATHPKKIEKNTFLSHEKEFSDFVLRVKVKMVNGNSGIQFRSEKRDGHVMAGYQADVAEKTYFGMLYEEQKRGILPYWEKLSEEERTAINAAAKLDDWNQYEITCEGHHVKMVLNGKTTLDFEDPEGATSGFIGLQLHVGPPMEVRFKDIEIKELKPKAAHYKPSTDEQYLRDRTALLMPLADANRSLRLGAEGERVRVPAGFAVEEVAPHELLGSVINMTYDHLGRPVVSAEGDGRGIFILNDRDADGRFDEMHSYAAQVQNAQGMHFIAPGDLLVNAHGAHGPGLYRLQDVNLDDQVDYASLLVPSTGGIGEHGPHAIRTGPDGYYYIMYGNHAHPKFPIAPESPLRGYQEDFLLPRYVDPRGHATEITAPGGTIVRLSPDFQRLEEVVGGFRNAYDFDFDASGEMFTFDSDMEWDFRLPWYRPVGVFHSVPGGDYGWRTGSSVMPSYYLDILPPVDDVGRGSPVGVTIYHHDAYPEKYQGAIFLGDWSRGRIRVLFPQSQGATFTGETVDFVVGEPLNVTDMDVAPDGMLYFIVGGRATQGGMFRVRWTGAESTEQPRDLSRVDALLTQPMPRSAWGEVAIQKILEEGGEAVKEQLKLAVADETRSPHQRVLAMEILQQSKPKPALDELKDWAQAENGSVRAAAVLLLGTFPLAEIEDSLINALGDADPVVRRRACEAFVRAGLSPEATLAKVDSMVTALFELLNDPDHFVRYAASQALERTARAHWVPALLEKDTSTAPMAVLYGLVALASIADSPADSDAIFAKLAEVDAQHLDDQVMIMYLRAIQMAYIRDKAEGAARSSMAAALGPKLLARFPSGNAALDRELQVILAHFQTPGAVEKLLQHLAASTSQEEQIHTVYCLRTIQDGWQPEQRAQLVAWFDAAREMGGGASLEGYINNLWEATLALLPQEEKLAAEQRKADALKKRQDEALALLEGGELKEGVISDLAQMSFEELSEYLEYDPMAYRSANLEHGQQVFQRAKCASCHVFGTIGKGGGPDLSTVTSRFRRRDILEAIMYPSKVVSDQYIGLEVELDDFSTVVGMAVAESDEVLTMITVNGERMEIQKDQIVARKEAEGSIMPEGLLHAMTMGELVDLINFLESGGQG